jgi:hypothetical protein
MLLVITLRALWLIPYDEHLRNILSIVALLLLMGPLWRVLSMTSLKTGQYIEKPPRVDVEE